MLPLRSSFLTKPTSRAASYSLIIDLRKICWHHFWVMPAAILSCQDAEKQVAVAGHSERCSSISRNTTPVLITFYFMLPYIYWPILTLFFNSLWLSSSLLLFCSFLTLSPTNAFCFVFLTLLLFTCELFSASLLCFTSFPLFNSLVVFITVPFLLLSIANLLSLQRAPPITCKASLPARHDWVSLKCVAVVLINSEEWQQAPDTLMKDSNGLCLLALPYCTLMGKKQRRYTHRLNKTFPTQDSSARSPS